MAIMKQRSVKRLRDLGAGVFFMCWPHSWRRLHGQSWDLLHSILIIAVKRSVMANLWHWCQRWHSEPFLWALRPST
ncbi:hypothetical protein GDO81_000899 [Engystomops pustulosus]|nr:hypothetical protein GDO81_000899 [Engystomops pustulosus]